VLTARGVWIEGLSDRRAASAGVSIGMAWLLIAWGKRMVTPASGRRKFR
jgi:hypothetical protein